MPRIDAELDLVLTGSPGQVQNWFVSEDLVANGAATAFAGLQSLPSANRLVSSVDPLMHRLAILSQQVVSRDAELASSVLHTELASVVASPWFGSSASFSADVGLGLTCRFRVWVSEVVARRDSTEPIEVVPLQPPARGEWIPLPSHAVSYVALASLDALMSEREGNDYLYKLDRIQSLFGLRPGEVTHLLDVSRQGMQKWQAGGSIAPERLASIDDLYNLAMWFASHVRPEALPAFMRRRIDALGHQTPVDWLLSRRSSELRRIYERAFSLETSQ